MKHTSPKLLIGIEALFLVAWSVLGPSYVHRTELLAIATGLGFVSLRLGRFYIISAVLATTILTVTLISPILKMSAELALWIMTGLVILLILIAATGREKGSA